MSRFQREVTRAERLDDLADRWFRDDVDPGPPARSVETVAVYTSLAVMTLAVMAGSTLLAGVSAVVLVCTVIARESRR